MGFQPTHGDRFGSAVQRPKHSATLCTTLEVRIIIPFSFLISVDSNSCRPVDAHFWSEIDYCWCFSYLDSLFGNWWKIFLTEKLKSRLWTNFLLIEKMDRDRIRTQARRLSFPFRFCFQSILFPIHPWMHSFDHRLTTVDFFLSW